MSANTVSLMARSATTELQNWAAGLVTQLTAAGWVQTSDTGQATFSSVTEPGSNNTSAGYQIWRMADTLQGTTPVFMRIEVGRGNNGHDPAVFITVGFSTDGAGNINSTRKTPTYILTQQSSEGTATTAYQCFFSGSTNRFSMMLWDDPTEPHVNDLFFSIERYKDTNGNDVSGGVIIYFRNGQDTNITYGSYATAGCACIILDATASMQRTVPWIAAYPGAYGGYSTMTNGGTVGTTVPIPCGPDPRNPTIGPLIYLGTDFTAYTTQTISVYGSNHTYMVTRKPGTNAYGVLPPWNNGWGNNSVTQYGDGFILMRYE